MPASRIVVVVGTRYPALSWALIRVLIATGGHLFFSRVRGKVISEEDGWIVQEEHQEESKRQKSMDREEDI